MKSSTIAATLSFILPGSGLWYFGKRLWGVVNLLLATLILAALAGHPYTGERIHYVLLTVSAGSAGLAHSIVDRTAKKARIATSVLPGHSEVVPENTELET